MRLYGYITKLHRGLYKSGLFASIKLNKKVLSVGNLTFGGTGKTPFVKSLAQDVSGPAIIVRSYKGRATQSARMDLEKSKHPEIWGDEACWYFQNLSIPIYSGPKKWESALLAAQDKNIETLIIDDGFQHHKLKKDVEMVLIDAVKGIKDLKCRSRDQVSALTYAAAVVITRANLVSAEKMKELEDFLNFSGPVFLNETKIVQIRSFQKQKIDITYKKIGLVSGIANPESFLNLMKQKHPQTEFVEMKYPDHHQFDLNDLNKISNQMKAEAISFILTTEKDETKLRHLGFDFSNWGVLEIESCMQNPPEFKNFLKGLNL